jgi:hypothetical protein
VRRRSPGSSSRPARLDYDHRFSQRYFARGGEKRPGIADRLHVKENALSVRIIAKVVNQVSPSHIQHGVSRNDSAEPHLLQLTPIQSQQGSTLAQKGYIAGPRRILGEGGVQADDRIHDAQAVGTNQAHGAAMQLFLNLPFQFDAFSSSFTKSRRDYNCGLGAGVHAFSDDAGNRGCGCGYDGQIYLLRNFADTPICLESQTSE